MQSAREGLRRYLKAQRNYAESVEAAGGIPLYIPQSAEPGRAAEYLEGMNALLLTGGQDISPLTYGEEPHQKLGAVDLQRDRWEIALYRAARELRLPILGICRGIQLMAVAEGGSLYQDIPAQTAGSTGHYPADMPMESLHHSIRIKEGSLLHSICGRDMLEVNSFHHQAVKEPGGPLQITAVSPSDDIIEALEDPSVPFLLGIQYHGEALKAIDPEYLELFHAFIAAAGETAPAKALTASQQG